MKHIVTILFFFISIAGLSQPTTTNPYLGTPQSITFIKGWARVDSGFLSPLKDTTLSPIRVGELRFRTADSALYIAQSTSSDNKWIKVGSGGGGGPTIYTGDGTLNSGRSVDLGGNFIHFESSNRQFLNIDPTIDAETAALIGIGSQQNSGRFVANSTPTTGTFYSKAEFNDGAHTALIQGYADADDATITYTADTHTFNGNVVYTTPPSGATTDSLVTWDAATGTLRTINQALFNVNLLVQPLGAVGEDELSPRNDTLYYRRIAASTFTIVDTTLDGGLTVGLDTSSASLHTFINTYGNSQWTTTGSNIYYNTGSVGIGNTGPAASSILELTSTTKGFLAPRMNTTQQNAIASPATGLLIYNTDSAAFRWFDGVWHSFGAGGGGSGTVSSIATTAPITGGTITTTGTIGITQSTTSTDGYLSSTDWNTFNNNTWNGIIQATPDTLTSTTGSQAVFNVNNGSGAGAITLAASTTYEFEMQFILTSMSATSGNAGFDILGAGTATLSSVGFSIIGRDALPNTSATITGGYLTTNSIASAMVVASSATSMQVLIKGIIRVNTGGTIIPSVNLTTAAAAITGVNSYFKYRKVGDSSVTVF